MNGEIKHLRQFGNFRLDSQKKVLWHNGEPVPMPLKELEVLCVLVENRGELVTKDFLLEKVWADSFVEESNLSRHIYLLR
jgi:DNA-binding winged helix-turn-helix (wHTH) protein